MARRNVRRAGKVARRRGRRIHGYAGSAARNAVLNGGAAAIGAAAAYGMTAFKGRKRPLPTPSVARRMKRRIVRKAGGPGTELQWQKRRIGRTKRLNVDKLAKVSMNTRILRWQNVGVSDRGGVLNDRGANWLSNVMTADTVIASGYKGGTLRFAGNVSNLSTGGAGFLRTSMHMYCLNSTLNTGGGTFGPALQPFIAQDGTVSFASLFGTSSDGASAQQSWSTEYVTSNPGALSSQKYIRNNWYQIKLCLRNANSQATYFDIQLVSFKESYLDPERAASGVASPAQENMSRNALYQYWASAGLTHPLIQKVGLKQALSGVKVLKRYRVVMNRENTTDSDASPNMKILNIFYRDGRIYDYQWGPPQNATAAPLALNNQNQYLPIGTSSGGVTSTLYQTTPKQRARIWMIIRAYDPTLATSDPTATAAIDHWGEALGAGTTDLLTAANSPSYDIVVRKKEQFRLV